MSAYRARFDNPPSPTQVVELRGALTAWMTGQGFPADTAGRVVTVVDELFCNTMEHSGAHWADVAVHNRGSGIMVSFRDDGSEFDPFEAGKKDFAVYLQSDTDRRLGLYLISRLASSMSYNREPEGVNVVDFTVAAEPPDPFKRLRKR